jgi:predicted dienelactone hydrolase
MGFPGLAILALCAAWVAGVLAGWRRNERWLIGFLVSAALVGAITVAVNSWYWQLVPGYGLLLSASIAAALDLGHPARRARPRWRIIASRSMLVLLLGIGLVLPLWLFPVPRYEKPSGPYQVGTRAEYWVDSTRTDPFAAGGGPRRLLVQIWYPAEPGRKAERVTNHPEPAVLAKALSDTPNGKLPTFLFSSIGRGLTWAYANALASGAERSFPLLVFSHGFGGTRFQNGFQMAELASHGYIIAGVEHVGTAAGSVFPDGAVVNMDSTHARVLSSDSGATRYADIWAADGEFTINRMFDLARSDPRQTLAGRIDTLHVGYFGHSFGGTTAANVMAIDRRVLAGINMDGYLAGTAWVNGLDRPFLQFRSDPIDIDIIDEALLEKEGTSRAKMRELMVDWDRRTASVLAGGGLNVHVRGSRHMNYSDYPLWSPPVTRMLGMTGSLDYRRAYQIINTLTLAFFDHYLKGKPEPILDDPAGTFPEVEVKRFPARR